MTTHFATAEEAAAINTKFHNEWQKSGEKANYVVLANDEGGKFISFAYGWIEGNDRPARFPQKDVFDPIGYLATEEVYVAPLADFQVTDALYDDELALLSMLGLVPSPHYLLQKLN